MEQLMGSHIEAPLVIKRENSGHLRKFLSQRRLNEVETCRLARFHRDVANQHSYPCRWQSATPATNRRPRKVHVGLHEYASTTAELEIVCGSAPNSRDRDWHILFARAQESVCRPRPDSMF